MSEDLRSAWRNQPAEERPVILESLITRRTQSLSSATRAEILTAIAATVFFVAVTAWRFASEWDRIPQVGFIAAFVWVVVSLYWFRARIWGRPTEKDALAATGLEHYRKELASRRDHLRNPWLWHGPLVLACLTLAAIFADQINFRGIQRELPLIGLLVIWAGLGFLRRLRQAADLQRELDEIPRE
jgi:hypothetical protein